MGYTYGNGFGVAKAEEGSGFMLVHIRTGLTMAEGLKGDLETLNAMLAADKGLNIGNEGKEKDLDSIPRESIDRAAEIKRTWTKLLEQGRELKKVTLKNLEKTCPRTANRTGGRKWQEIRVCYRTNRRWNRTWNGWSWIRTDRCWSNWRNKCRTHPTGRSSTAA